VDPENRRTAEIRVLRFPAPDHELAQHSAEGVPDTAGAQPTAEIRSVSSMETVSDPAHGDSDGPQGLSTLPRDLTEEELRHAPVLASADLLVMDDLTEEEFEAFDQAIHS